MIHLPYLKRASRLAAMFSITIGSLVILGWMFDVAILKGVFSNYVTMKANTAFGFIFAGCGLLAQSWSQDSKRTTRISRFCAGALALLGLLTLAQYLTGLNFSIDQMMFHEPVGTIGTLSPGRMAPATAVGFILYGCALILSSYRRTINASQWLVLPVGLIGSLTLLAEIYGPIGLYGLGYFIQMAVNTVVTFVILTLGLLVLNPTDGFMSAFSSDKLGGWLLRRMMVFTICVPILLGWLKITLDRMQIVETPVAAALLILTFIVLLIGVLWRMADSLNKVDTRRQKYEMELIESERRFQLAIKQSPFPIMIHAEDGEVVMISDVWTELTGYAHQDIPTIHAWTEKAYGVKKDVVKNYIDHLYELTGKAKEGEYEIRTRSGDIRIWDFMSAFLGKDAQERRMVISMAMDVTERRQADEESAKLQFQLHQAQKMESLGTLVAGVAHNLNNVLAIAMGTVSLREDLVTDPADREAYQSIGKVCMRGREVVKSLIHFAQPTVATQSAIEVRSLIQEVCALLESTTRNRIKIVESMTEEPLWINGSAGDLNHILVNIGINSFDAMPNGGHLIFRTTILEGNWVEVSVEDNGTGMTPEVLYRAMEPFYTTKEVGKGTGLGLSMAYGVVKAHGGTIDITSHLGQGTTVKLRFPRIPAPPESEPALANAAIPTLSSMKVFLVDDEEDVRFLMTRMLKKAGVRQVKVFSGGEEVLEALPSDGLPDLIILDQNMPGLNGVQTMVRIRDLHPDMPILISSGQPDIEAWDDFKLPRVGIISKPFTMEEIQAKLAQFPP